MSKKQIQIPASVEIEGKKLSFFEFARFALNDARYGQGLEAAERRVRTREAIEISEATGEALLLQPTDWSVLRDAMCTPSNPYNPAVNEAAIPFMLAVREAKNAVSAVPGDVEAAS